MSDEPQVSKQSIDIQMFMDWKIVRPGSDWLTKEKSDAPTV